MVFFGAITAWSRAGGVPGAFGPLLVALSLAGGLTLGLVIALGIFPVEPRYLVPVGGMVIGNAMTAAAVALDRLGDEIRQGRDQIETTLPSAPNTQGAAPVLRRSLRSGICPGRLDEDDRADLLPGRWSDAPAGAEVTDAVRLSSSCSTCCWQRLDLRPDATLLARRNFFTPAHQLARLPVMAAPIIFSGIQPTGRKHLGNYIGAIRQYVEGQERGDPAIFCIVDLHAITVAYEPDELRRNLYDTLAILLAAGLDPERCILFRQSDVREHTELCWLLAAVTAHGDLNRMHQFKDKSARQRELVSAGLFLYPVLQAADVLAYRATEVPVGEDQRQHVELMREIARRFNERFGETLVEPELRVPPSGPGSWTSRSPTARCRRPSVARPAGSTCSTSRPRSARSSAAR